MEILSYLLDIVKLHNTVILDTLKLLMLYLRSTADITVSLDLECYWCREELYHSVPCAPGHVQHVHTAQEEEIGRRTPTFVI